MENQQHILYKPIGQIVADDYRTLEIFQSHNIDFYFEGNKNIQRVTDEHKLDQNLLLNEIQTVQRTEQIENIFFQTWPLDLLVDYIEKKHHRYIRKNAPVVKDHLNCLCETYGKKNPNLLEVYGKFNECLREFKGHMKNEELFLFPIVRKMVMAQNAGVKLASHHFGSMQNPIRKMVSAHKTESERFKQIVNLTNNYTIPVDTCETYTMAYTSIQNFANDLQTHIHLENNILFPKIKALEKQLKHEP